MKGIIMAGGSGTRLYPLTSIISKQLLPVYDKPLIYYPLTTLMSMGIRDILIISTPTDTPRFMELLGDGSKFGIHLSYKIQYDSEGLGQAFLIGEDYLKNDSCVLILGDNIFYGNSLSNYTDIAIENANNGTATIFSYYVSEPQRFGVVELDREQNILSMEEKPEHPKSNYGITGLYFYDSRVTEMAKKVKPSKRGELEITDLNHLYLEESNLKVQILDRDCFWLDTGTMDSLLEASNFVKNIQKRQKTIISAPEETAFRKHWISREQLLTSANLYGKSPYGEYLRKAAESET